MHALDLTPWQHDHQFTGDGAENEKKTLRVVILTGVMMVIEIIAGWAFGSMALLAYGLLTETSSILLDGSADPKIAAQIKTIIEQDADNRVIDLHVWKLNAADLAVIIGVVTHYPQPVAHYRNLLANLNDLKHITVEIHICQEAPCLPED